MTTRVIRLGPDVKGLGPTVTGLGVFDGVHLGHQGLLRAVVRRARRLGHPSAALTFDRDPDQIVTPSTAAPQLLTLEDKLRYLTELGLDVVLVVPFTEEVAVLTPERFLEEVVAPVLGPIELHVGADFRFGAKAAGDLETLYVWGAENGVDITPHELVQVDGAPVTSTRIRAAVAEGDVDAAQRLLGRPHRVAGTVKHGRGEGAALGVATANVEAAEYAALPADGAYAGRAQTPLGPWPAAISVGVPPTFAAATDRLEAHLIGFTGDLYGAPITLEFFSRLRPNRAFGSTDELVATIEGDIAETVRIVEERRAEARQAIGENETLPDGSPVVTDPEALRTAQTGARADSLAPAHPDVASTADWVEVTSVMDFTGLPTDQGNIINLIALQSALEDAGIPTAWDPYPPYTSTLVPYNARVWRSLKLLTTAEHVDEARRIASSAHSVRLPPEMAGPPMQTVPGWKRAGVLFFILFLITSLGGSIGWGLARFLGR